MTAKEFDARVSENLELVSTGLARLGQVLLDAGRAFAGLVMASYQHEGGRLAAMRGAPRDWSQSDSWHRGS